MRLAIIILAAAALGMLTAGAMAGCHLPGSDPEPLRPATPAPQTKGMTLTPFTQVKPEKVDEYVIFVRLHFITVQLPMGSVSQSEQMWSYVNEEALGERAAIALGANGIRVGVGKEATWPEVHKALRALTGQPLARSDLLTQADAPVSYVLKPRQAEQTMFVFNPDRTLEGRDFPPGDDVLGLVPTIDYDDPSFVLFSAVPLVRTTQQKMEFVEDPAGGFAFRAKSTTYRIGQLDFRMKVPVGGFILIGPSREVTRRSSLGHHFLVRDKDGVECETVVVISPEIFATQAGGTAP
jgi:hypothetical protein